MKIYIYVLSLSYDLSMNRRRTSLFSLTFSRLLPYQPQGYKEAKKKLTKPQNAANTCFTELASLSGFAKI